MGALQDSGEIRQSFNPGGNPCYPTRISLEGDRPIARVRSVAKPLVTRVQRTNQPLVGDRLMADKKRNRCLQQCWEDNLEEVLPVRGIGSDKHTQINAASQAKRCQ